MDNTGWTKVVNKKKNKPRRPKPVPERPSQPAVTPRFITISTPAGPPPTPYYYNKPNREFCETLKREREKLGLTQKQLAQQVSMSDTLLRKLEAGDVTPAPAEVHMLSSAIGIRLPHINRQKIVD